MNLDKKIKLLIIIINRLGVEVNYEVVTKYSKTFDTIKSEYFLKFWKKKKYKDKKTGENKEKYYCETKSFYRIDQVAKYLLAIKESKEEGMNGRREKAIK